MFTPLPSTSPISVRVCEMQERLLNFRDSGEMNAMPWDVAQEKKGCVFVA